MAPKSSCTGGTPAGFAVVDHITAEGGKARFFAADLSDPVQLDDLAGQAAGVDVLVNNAGDLLVRADRELDVVTFDWLFAANVRAPVFLVAALAPRMAARGRGSIITIGSQAGSSACPVAPPTAPPRAPLASMTRSWAAEFSPAGVRVNTVVSVLSTPPVPVTGAERSRRGHHHHGPGCPA